MLYISNKSFLCSTVQQFFCPRFYLKVRPRKTLTLISPLGIEGTLSRFSLWHSAEESLTIGTSEHTWYSSSCFQLTIKYEWAHPSGGFFITKYIQKRTLVIISYHWLENLFWPWLLSHFSVSIVSARKKKNKVHCLLLVYAFFVLPSFRLWILDGSCQPFELRLYLCYVSLAFQMIKIIQRGKFSHIFIIIWVPWV